MLFFSRGYPIYFKLTFHKDSLHEKQAAINNSLSRIVSKTEKCTETTVNKSRFSESVQNPRIKNRCIPVFAVAVFGSSPNFRLTLSVLGQLMGY